MSAAAEPIKRRKTRQRALILKILRDTKSHPTADWIYNEVRKEIPDISLGTVYRNLRLLKEMGEIQELQWGSTYSRFDGNPEEHYHFNCEKCGQVLDVDIDVQRYLEEKVEEKHGWKVTKHRLEFWGLCHDCQEEAREVK
ncbi:MAG: transcriptional repressor [bacterium]|jgi:Fur family peroxide stress response transcriptional regulator|nr:transcriptional repressor [Bacillota bacterium]HHW54420.1 transcriptional repressor [Bacillota bacterium]